ncbi:hypothetical protein B0H10DRAFT_12833 [Mycena sp. CBHHK59/15]|nr:hypothetical protein B0H10DRAFT_12833 [Mycena sp. CBHHK59/15]
MRSFKPIGDSPCLQKFYLFNDIPEDVCISIMENCSPFDLVQLALVSKSFLSFIRINRDIWAAAHGNVSRGDCPRIPEKPNVEASGDYSQIAYAKWLFGGGLCTWCSKSTDSQPASFLFRFRACSYSCRKMLSSDACLVVDQSGHLEETWGQWLPRLEIVAQSGQVTCIYSKRAMADAKREVFQAAAVDAGKTCGDTKGCRCRTINQLKEEHTLRARSRSALLRNVIQLKAWQEAYQKEHKNVQRENLNFIKEIASKQNIKLKALMRCPTTNQTFLAFNRDLALLTHTVWAEIRTTVFKELNSMYNGVFPDGMLAGPNDRVRCSLCPRIITATGLVAHTLASHKDQDPDTIPSLPQKNLKHCRDCPDSQRVFSERGLKDHQRDRHN